MEFKVGEVYEIYTEAGYWLRQAVGIQIKVYEIKDNTIFFKWRTGPYTNSKFTSGSEINIYHARKTLKKLITLCYPDE